VSWVLHLPKECADDVTHTIDMQSMVELTKFVRRLGKTAPLADIVGTTPWVQSRVHTVADDHLAVLPLRVLGSTRA
jgi:hypothetical protein